MSIELVARILNTPTELSPTAKMVLVGLANHANPDGTRAFPSKAMLARYAECDPRTVQRHLRALEDAGWIEQITPAHEGRQYRPPEYLIKGDKLSPLGGKGDISGPARETFEVVKGDKAVSPRTVIEPSRTVSDSFDQFWIEYPRKIGKLAASRAFTKAVKGGADPEDILAGARAYAADPRRRREPIEYTAHPATWLNAGRWLDEPDEEAGPRRITDDDYRRARGEDG